MSDERTWLPARWSELVSDTEDGDPIGDIIRLTWDDGTVLIGRLTVGSQGSGHNQVCRMQTRFGGDTWVYPHGSTLEAAERPVSAPARLCGMEISVEVIDGDGRRTGWLCHRPYGHFGPHEGLLSGYPSGGNS